MLGVFALASPKAVETVVFPRGVRDNLSYEVSFDNARTTAAVNGYELKQNGVRVSLDGGMSSELSAYKAIED